MIFLKWAVPRERVCRAWCLYDGANSAFATVILTALFPVYFSQSVVPDRGLCLLAHCVPGPSLWAYGVSISVLIAALFAPLAGKVADTYGLRKPLFILFVLSGAGATAMMLFAYPGWVWYALVCFLIGHLSFLFADVMYNSYLPIIAPENKHDILSSQGYAWGYVGGGLLLAFQFFILGLPGIRIEHNDFFIIRLCLASVGIWWLLFSLPAMVWLPASAIEGLTKHSVSEPSCDGFLSSLKRIKETPGALLFLTAFFFYNNGIQTVISMAAIYGSYRLGITQKELMGALLVTQFVAFPGALLFGFLADKFGTLRILLGNLAVWCLIVTYAVWIRRSLEFWILAGLSGLVLGGSQALSRSAFTKFIKDNRSGEFFGFYAMGGRFSSLLGPFVFGMVFDATRSMEVSILSVLFFFLMGAVLLWSCRVRWNGYSGVS
ncbi:MFS transporter [Thermodesulforhabdus norvegica]|uniref:MFS transporter, UMF1 family n=1 Tax=Thermodesulforhabdus norvegica TaxID=39841 RepID=A0A1I4QKH4_9BACT|nr:MFS transporter [Thermodesulforhabdus norvegica]SFM40123.1 MFS transporter, UMF1 family [Thermodesulforhabdus norvegica]